MAVYARLMAELDANSQHFSEQISEIDLTDPEDARVLMPEQGADILAHFGEDHFLERYQRYQAHIAEWRQQYPKLAAVDLRYDHQVVLEMASGADCRNRARRQVADAAPAAVPPAAASSARQANRRPANDCAGKACLRQSRRQRRQTKPKSASAAKPSAKPKRSRKSQSSRSQDQSRRRQEDARLKTAAANPETQEALPLNPPGCGRRSVSTMTQKQDNLIVVLDIGSAWTRVLAADSMKVSRAIAATAWWSRPACARG